MSHTLHRIAGSNALSDDFVILVMAASDYNKDEAVSEKYKKYFEIFEKHNPVNWGGMGIGHICETNAKKIYEALADSYPGLPMVHGVFATREDLVGALKDIKDADIGLSVIVSGLVDATECCANDADIKRHSINFSLGTWGRTEKLPDERILQISTMCGHAMISFNLINKKIEDIKAGRTTPEKAAIDLAEPCACGIFNPVRAQNLLEEFV